MKWKKAKATINWTYEHGFLDSGGAPWSPLHIAVRQGHLDCVKLLISAGAIVNSVNAGKHTPLHEAAYRGYDDIILELLLRGADPHAASNQKRTPLHEACIQGMLSSITSTTTLVLISFFKMIKNTTFI